MITIFTTSILAICIQRLIVKAYLLLNHILNL